jgi:hypothetical protein
MSNSLVRSWRWAAIPFGVAYLVLLALHLRGVVTATNLDADAVSAPVIGQLFGSAPSSAHVVLGEFGWYSTLLFELATKWLPEHRQIWELAPYTMALAGAALTAWSVWQVAGRFAAAVTAVLLVCAAPATLHLLLSMTQHAPDWFCLGLLSAFLVLIERRGSTLRLRVLAPLSALVGIVVGVNAASDPLVVLAGLVPFVLSIAGCRLLAGEAGGSRTLGIALATLLVIAIAWAGTAFAMAALDVGAQQGLHTDGFATAGKVASNFKLWWQSIAVLGNGDFFGRDLTFTSGLAFVCAVLSIGAVVLLPRLGWSELRLGWTDRLRPAVEREAIAPERLAFMVFWCSSAVLLTVGFLASAIPVDIHADRYLVGLIYAAAAVIPVVAARRVFTQAAALVGTCAFALAGVISMAQGTVTQRTGGFPPTDVARRVAAIAGARHLKVGYAGYWDAAPITWAAHFRVLVYPVSVCDQGAHLCPFDLHYISSWYTPRPGVWSFLLTDRRLRLVPAPTPDLGPAVAVYDLGQLTMYVYRYDIAAKLSPT